MLFMTFALLSAVTCAPSGDAAPEESTHGMRIIAAHPHDHEAFTQGLFFHDGKLYESTGHYGYSTIRITDPTSGAIIKQRRLKNDQFGEGLTMLGNVAVQLTWKARTGLIYDLTTLKPLSSFRFAGEGWGLASSTHGLVMSHGSATLTFLDMKTLEQTRTITVTENGKEVRHLNELEWYGKVLLANIWMRDVLVAIDPLTGQILARIDLSPLRTELPKDAGVANGIAYDAAGDRLFVTGKNWNKLFEIKITLELK